MKENLVSETRLDSKVQTSTSPRGINVNLRHNLIEVKPESKEAVFQHLDTQETVCIKTIKTQMVYQSTR